MTNDSNRTPVDASERTPLYAVDAQPVEQKEAAPKSVAMMFDGFDWDQLVDEVYVSWTYGCDKYEAVNRVKKAFELQFSEHLRQALKERSRQQWNEETYERLRKEFEAKGKAKQ
jgi:hypothetical protein